VSSPPIQPGDVVEVELANGYWACIQLVGLTYVTKERDLPKSCMVRVLPGVYASVLSDEQVGILVSRDAAFFSQVPLRGMLSYGQVRGRWPLPDHEADVPATRFFWPPSAENPRGWKVVTPDHQVMTEVEYSKLHPEIDQAMLPLDWIETPARLRWLIEVGWTPRVVRSRTDNWWSNKGTYRSLAPSEI